MMNQNITPKIGARVAPLSSSTEEDLEKLSMKELKNLRKKVGWQIRKLNAQLNDFYYSYGKYYNLSDIIRKIKSGEAQPNEQVFIDFGIVIEHIRQIQSKFVDELQAVEISEENLKTIQDTIMNRIKRLSDKLSMINNEIERRKKIREAILKSTHQAINSGKYVPINDLKQLYKDNKKVFGD